ncbi:hypothetical protein K474DRAFT_1650027 [Panus rudis PR-1116 ss-1]|nr:hypothetical protein K474DRAFT_1650027 [Panus rudis PR-1116 ss-1]
MASPSLIGRCLYDFIRYFLEAQFASDDDAYGSAPEELPLSDKAIHGRAQIAEYAGEVLERQPCLFVYSLYVYKQYFRVQKWDRNGMVMSTREDYKQDPMKLIRLIYRLAKMSDEQAGYDPTVEVIGEESIEIQMMKETINASSFRALPAHIQWGVRDAMQDVLEPLEQRGAWQRPLYRVSVPALVDDTATSECSGAHPCLRDYIIGRRKTRPSPEPFGRGTRGYIAFDLEAKDFVFLKDAWRASSSNAEADVYSELQKHGVPYVPTLRCGGDLHGQCTSSNEYLKMFNEPMLHHRLVITEIGQPLDEYYDSQALCLFLYCALTAHWKAWEDAGILHRDISDNNIIIVTNIDEDNEEVLSAVLIDWDLSKYRSQLANGEVSDGNLSGTWAFLSAPRLKYPGKRWELADDLEAFAHLVDWFALKYHDHDVDREDLAAFLASRFYDCKYDEATRSFYGCREKTIDVQNGRSRFTLRFADPETKRPQNLAILIDTLMAFCKLHWDSLDHVSLSRHAVARHKEQLKETTASASGAPSKVKGKGKLAHVAPPGLLTISEKNGPSQPLASSISSPAHSPPTPLSPFRNHLEMIRVLWETYAKEGWPTTTDKKDDQFKGLGPIAQLQPDSRTPKILSSSLKGRSSFVKGKSPLPFGMSSSKRYESASGVESSRPSRSSHTRPSSLSRATVYNVKIGSKRKATDIMTSSEFIEGSSRDVSLHPTDSPEIPGSKRNRIE